MKFPANSVKSKLDDNKYPKGKYGKGSSSVELLNEIEIKDGVVINEFELKGPFIWSQDFLDNELKIGSELVMNTTNFQPRAYRNSDEKFKGFPSFIDGREFSATNDDAYDNLIEIFGEEKVFDYSKPYNFVKYLINSILYFDKHAIVLDSFAGSGTTAHSVLKLNKEDNGNRKFVIIEMENYIDDVTVERVKKVIQGYGDKINEKKGTGGCFDYYELGAPIFKEDQNLNEEIGEDKIREYIYYSETKQYLSRQRAEEHKYLLDTFQDTGFYFYYEKDNLTTLDYETLNIVTEKAEQYLIYADRCLLDKEYMLSKNILFKKIPRDIKRF